MNKPRNHANPASAVPAQAPAQPSAMQSSAMQLGRGAVLNMAGFGLFTLSQWGVLSLLARMSGPEMVGLYSLGLAIAVPVFLLTGLSLRPAFATDHTGHWPLGVYVRLRVWASLFGGFFALAVALYLATERQSVPLVPFVALMLVMVIAKWAEAASDMGNAIYQAADRMALVGRSLGLRGVVGVVMFGAAGLAMLATQRSDVELVLVAATGLTLAWIGVFWLIDRPSATKIARNELADRSAGDGSLPSLLWAVVPLGTAIFITSLQVNLPRFVVEQQFGLGALGLFAGVMAFYGVGTQAVNTAGQAVMTRLAHAYREGQIARQAAWIGALIVFALLGGAALLGLAYFAGGPLLALVYGDKFAEADMLFVSVALVALVRFVAEALRVMLVAARRFRLRFGFEVIALGLLAASFWTGLRGETVLEIPRAMLIAELASLALLVVLVTTLVIRSGAVAKKSRTGGEAD